MAEILKAVLFGVVEGITEWLPISSTGHMILLEEFVQLEVTPEFWSMFLVVIQLGAIMAVVMLYWNRIFPFRFGGGSLMRAVEYIFLFSGGLTVAYMTKLFVAIFMEENADKKVQKKFDGIKVYMSAESIFALGGSALVLLVWGLFPHTIMDRAAELGQGLMHLEESGHTVSYFSLTNLSGALISISIGVVVYVLVIRKLLMRKGKAGEREYINAWPAWMDMENLIYRPLLLGFLPFVSRLICRVFDSFLDTLAVLLRKTFYRDSPLPHELPEGNGLTLIAGRVMNFWRRLGNRIHHRDGSGDKDYVHVLAMKYEEFMESNRIIERSLSFGLLLFCIGLSLTLIYIILW